MSASDPMPVVRRWLCRWMGHEWQRVGRADTGYCWATISECRHCGRRSDRWPPR